MGYKIVFAPQAEQDLDAIVEYIASSDFNGAYCLGSLLLNRVDSLVLHTHLGVISKQRKNVRYIVHYPYLIFYRVDNKNKRIEILRFWHGARNPQSLSF